MREKLAKAISKAVGVDESEISFEVPKLATYGDLSTNIALVLAKNRKRSPLDLAEEIKNKISNDDQMVSNISLINVVAPGFINFWFSDNALFENLREVISKKSDYGENSILKGRKILIEHTSPNPQTTIMLGHLRNNFLGMAVSRILEKSGARVVKDCIVNDRGVHICRSIWGYLMFADKKSNLDKSELINFKDIKDQKIEAIVQKSDWKKSLSAWRENKKEWLHPSDLEMKPDHANLIWYVLGSKAYKDYPEVKLQVSEILQAWEKEQEEVWDLWKQIIQWSGEGYEKTYKDVDSIHDYVWYESNLYKGGREFVEEGLKKGIFIKSKGAIVTNLNEYNLPDTVAIKSDGTSTYLVFDINLTAQKIKKFPSDLYIWTIGSEQTLYFKQLFAVCEKLGLGKLSDFYHLSYGLINFKGGGKMATREGSVVKADDIIGETKEKCKGLIKTSNEKLRKKIDPNLQENLINGISIGAIKYSLLKPSRDTVIFYDINESISLEGNSGPYLQYTYSRARSVLQKAGNLESVLEEIANTRDINDQEKLLLRMINQYPGIIVDAAKNYSPSTICTYLYNLAQLFNSYYANNKIIGSDNQSFKLALTLGVSQVIRNGLELLGISSPERM